MADPEVPLDDLPLARPEPSRRRRLPFVWILPLLVVVIGACVVVQQKLAEGPLIDIQFQGADGIEANKTKIRYKDVDIGDVTDLRVAPDRKHVIVTARIHRDSRDYLVEDTRFWVVRPRFTAGNISGLGTLVSGVYISVDVGRSSVERRQYDGLEVPPIVTSDLPGREFVLHADTIGSLAVGSSVYFRHMTAGQVIAYSLDPGGASVTIKVFIDEPFAAYVTRATRFWQASGIDMAVDANGVTLHTESLASILEGGIAFQSLPNAPAAAPAPADAAFPLFSDRERAMRQPDTEVQKFVMYFRGSLRGLSIGAPVDLRGIPIGEVKGLSVEYEPQHGTLRFPVEVDVFPQRIRGRHGEHPLPNVSDGAGRRLVDSLVAHGMRAELRTGSLLTGQKFVALDYHAEAPPEQVGWSSDPPIFPTAAGALDEIQDSVGSIAKKLDRMPIDRIADRLNATLATLDATLKHTDHLVGQFDGTIAPQVAATLDAAKGAMQDARAVLGENAPLQTDLSAALLELSRAAKSLGALADYLERHPESLLRGKPQDKRP